MDLLSGYSDNAINPFQGFNNALASTNQTNNWLNNQQNQIAQWNQFDPFASGGGFGKQTDYYSGLGAAFGRQTGGFGGYGAPNADPFTPVQQQSPDFSTLQRVPVYPPQQAAPTWDDMGGGTFDGGSKGGKSGMWDDMGGGSYDEMTAAMGTLGGPQTWQPQVTQPPAWWGPLSNGPANPTPDVWKGADLGPVGGGGAGGGGSSSASPNSWLPQGKLNTGFPTGAGNNDLRDALSRYMTPQTGFDNFGGGASGFNPGNGFDPVGSKGFGIQSAPTDQYGNPSFYPAVPWTDPFDRNASGG
jgi:hypothetical protein